MHPVQPAGLEPAQEPGPERAGLAVADVEAEDLPTPVRGHAGGDDDGLRGHPAAPAAAVATDPGLAERRVEEHIGEGGLGQRPVPECGHLHVEVGANSGHLALGDPGVGAHRDHQVINLSGRGAGDVGLHHHREQRLVDPPAPLEQAREERPGPQLRDPQFHIPGRGRHHPIPIAIALGHPRLGPLMRLGADPRGRLRVNQRLEERLHTTPDDIVGVGGLEHLKQFEQGKLVQGHRVLLLREFFGRISQRLTRWPLNVQEPGREIHHSRGRDQGSPRDLGRPADGKGHVARHAPRGRRMGETRRFERRAGISPHVPGYHSSSPILGQRGWRLQSRRG